VAATLLFGGTATAGEAKAPEPKAAEPKAAPPARRPVVRPPVAAPMGELPDTPETPAEKLPAQFFAATGQVCLQYAQWTKAEECFREAYGREKDAGARADYAFSLGQLLMRKKDYDKALPLLEEAIKNVPEASRGVLMRRCRLALAALYEKMNQPEKVEALYQEWMKDPSNPMEAEMARRELLRYWQRAGKLEAAVAKYEAALKEKPDDKQALEMLSLVYTSIKPDPQKSLAVAEKLVELQPQDRAAAMQLLSAYEQAAQYDKAIALVSKLTERYPDAADTLTFRLAYLYVRSGQKEKAKEFAASMLAKGPEMSQRHGVAAGIYLQLNMLDDALDHYETAARLAKSDPEREGYLLSAARTAQRAKKYPKAEELAKGLAKSSSKATAAQAKRLLFDLYEEQKKLDQLEIKPGEK
jgi:tetratricopeptide (TPR) repeat protein